MKVLTYLAAFLLVTTVNMGGIGFLAFVNGMGYSEAAVYWLLGALVAAETGALYKVWRERP